MAIEKEQLKISLSKKDMAVIKAYISQRGLTWTEFIRALFKIPAENPRPCVPKYPDIDSEVP